MIVLAGRQFRVADGVAVMSLRWSGQSGNGIGKLPGSDRASRKLCSENVQGVLLQMVSHAEGGLHVYAVLESAPILGLEV